MELRHHQYIQEFAVVPAKNYDGVYLLSDSVNLKYHTGTDTWSKLDLPAFKQIVAAAIITV